MCHDDILTTSGVARMVLGSPLVPMPPPLCEVEEISTSCYYFLPLMRSNILGWRNKQKHTNSYEEIGLRKLCKTSLLHSLCCTVRLTSTGNPVSGNKEFRLAPNETLVEQLKNEKSHLGHGLRIKTSGDMLGLRLLNRLTAIGAREHQLFDKLLW